MINNRREVIVKPPDTLPLPIQTALSRHYQFIVDRIELPKDSDDESERHVFQQVEAVTALRSRLPCY
jgi:hypothetical protein